MAGNIAVILLFRILDVVRDSGANRQEAECALRAAAALLPELGLPLSPTAVYRSA